VWTFPSVRPYKGKHPAEKPAAMLEHAIEATTFPGDIVLDCFGGGGSTALAALKLKCRTVSMEIEPAWVAEIASRVEDAAEADTPFLSTARNGNGHALPRALRTRACVSSTLSSNSNSLHFSKIAASRVLASSPLSISNHWGYWRSNAHASHGTRERLNQVPNPLLPNQR